MANPYEVELRLYDELAALSAGQDTTILDAWTLAWSEVAADLFDTLNDQLGRGGRITAATVVRSERMTRILASLADTIEGLATDAGVVITSDLDQVIGQAVRGTRRLIEVQLPGGRSSRFDAARVPPPAVLAAIVRRSTEQITSITLPIADETYATIQREVIRGVAGGDNPRETARRMVARSEDLYNFGASRALNVARTETLDAYREGARVSQDQHTDLLAGWIWLAHLGPRTCRSCLANHGRMHPLTERGPDDHQQGRCTRSPVVAEEDGSIDLSWVPDVDDHFNSLDRADQVAILGRKGYRAWVSGDFPREAWTKTRTADGWRESQVPAAPGDSDGGSGLPTQGAGRDPGDSRGLPFDEDFTYNGELRRPGGPPAPFSYAELDAMGVVAPADDPHRHFSPAEQAVADWLLDRGVQVLSVADADDVGSTPDAVLVGSLVTVEFKTLERETSVTVRNAAKDGRKQAERVLIDGRDVSLSGEVAAVGLARALGIAGLDLRELVVILSGGTSVGWWRG